jgi:hypothetical protein
MTKRYYEAMAAVVKTVKVPQALAARLARVAKTRGCSESELIREGIERVAREDGGLDMQKLIGADVGSGKGPRDLSASRRHMVGYGRSRHR